MGSRMSRVLFGALFVSGCLVLGGPVFAQGTNSPAGKPAVTAPGGDQGIAGPTNIRRAIRRGNLVGIGRARRPVKPKH